MVTGSSALETSEDATAEVRREGTVFSSLGRFMQGTFAPHLVARTFENDKPQEFKDFHHANIGSNLSKVDARHRRPFWIQRRGTRHFVIQDNHLTNNTHFPDEPLLLPFSHVLLG